MEQINFKSPDAPFNDGTWTRLLCDHTLPDGKGVHTNDRKTIILGRNLFYKTLEDVHKDERVEVVQHIREEHNVLEHYIRIAQ